MILYGQHCNCGTSRTVLPSEQPIYKGKPKKRFTFTGRRPGRGGVEVMIDGKRYDNITQAADDLGIPYHVLRYAVSNRAEKCNKHVIVYTYGA